MKFKEFFFGTVEEKEAKNKIKELKAQKNLKDLKRRKQTQLETALKIRRKYFWRIGLLLLVALTPIVAISGKSIYQKIYNDRFELRRQRIEQGLNMVWKDLPTLDLASAQKALTQNPDDLNHLIMLKSFYQTVGWAKINSKREVLTMSGGYSSGAWIAIYEDPKDAPPQQAPFSISREYPNILEVKTTDISQEWLGILLIHELSHLFDRISGLEPDQPDSNQYLTGEAFAYMSESMVLDHYTKGNFTKAIASFAELQQLKSLNDAVLYWQQTRTNPRLYADMFNYFNAIMPTAKALSTEEKALRMGLYQIAVSFYLIDRNNPNQDNFAKYLDYLKIIYAPQLNGLTNN